MVQFYELNREGRLELVDSKKDFNRGDNVLLYLGPIEASSDNKNQHIGGIKVLRDIIGEDVINSRGLRLVSFPYEDISQNSLNFNCYRMERDSYCSLEAKELFEALQSMTEFGSSVSIAAHSYGTSFFAQMVNGNRFKQGEGLEVIPRIFTGTVVQLGHVEQMKGDTLAMYGMNDKVLENRGVYLDSYFNMDTELEILDKGNSVMVAGMIPTKINFFRGGGGDLRYEKHKGLKDHEAHILPAYVSAGAGCELEVGNPVETPISYAYKNALINMVLGRSLSVDSLAYSDFHSKSPEKAVPSVYAQQMELRVMQAVDRMNGI